ncbi:hypothetical protein [Oleispirillum naphthae]|uniref:hypothetical protein n=1 Tax=Oleispirillum naphthae TaxID=2838853 RepID=UPI0030824899
MKARLLGMCLALGAAVGVAAGPAGAADKPISGNLRIVIGSSSTGGDTYQNAAIVAEALSKKLGINAKVDAVGVSAAFAAVTRVSDGSTVMFFHDQSYLGHLLGLKGYPDIFKDLRIGPTVSINPGDAFVGAKDSKLKTIEDVIQACGKGERVRVAIQPGGVSEVYYGALKNAVGIRFPGKEGNLVSVKTGSQGDKNQLLFDRQAEVIHGSVQANEQYTRLPAEDQKAMRFLWLPSPSSTISQANPEGMGATGRDELLKFTSPNVHVTLDGKADFTFDKEFFFLYNKKMDPKAVAYLDKALSDIFAEGKVQVTLKKAFFIPNFHPSKEAAVYLKKKAEQSKALIAATR